MEELLSFSNMATNLKITNRPIVRVEDLHVSREFGGIVKDTPLVGDRVDVLDGDGIWVRLLLSL